LIILQLTQRRRHVQTDDGSVCRGKPILPLRLHRCLQDIVRMLHRHKPGAGRFDFGGDLRSGMPPYFMPALDELFRH
jgi:hypothetical protein